MYRFGVGLNIANVVLSSSVVVRRLCRPPRSCAGWLSSRRTPVRQPRFTRHASSSYQPFTSNVNAEPFLNGTSAVYVEELYEDWLEDPTSVHKVGNRNTTHSSLLDVASSIEFYYVFDFMVQ